jgi:hypothetical protein
MENPFLVLLEVVRVFERQSITYVLVGSLASSMHGMYRSTADIDFLADIKHAQVHPLLKALDNNFYIDEHAVRQAITERRSFTAIHFDSVFKIDIFIPQADAFAQQQLARRQARRIAPDIDQEVYVATAEDTILAKLRWYRVGGEVSGQQWNDVLGVRAANKAVLDGEYLLEWAEKVGVLDLFHKALDEAD